MCARGDPAWLVRSACATSRRRDARVRRRRRRQRGFRCAALRVPAVRRDGHAHGLARPALRVLRRRHRAHARVRLRGGGARGHRARPPRRRGPRARSGAARHHRGERDGGHRKDGVRRGPARGRDRCGAARRAGRARRRQGALAARARSRATAHVARGPRGPASPVAVAPVLGQGARRERRLVPRRGGRRKRPFARRRRAAVRAFRRGARRGPGEAPAPPRARRGGRAGAPGSARGVAAAAHGQAVPPTATPVSRRRGLFPRPADAVAPLALVAGRATEILLEARDEVLATSAARAPAAVARRWTAAGCGARRRASRRCRDGGGGRHELPSFPRRFRSARKAPREEAPSRSCASPRAARSARARRGA